jgi:alcohol dehydrogenase YqhD (iron-dependent ADH family)
MLNFNFYAPARILFGKGEESRVGELLKPRAKKVLLHYGGGSVKKSGLYERIAAL